MQASMRWWWIRHAPTDAQGSYLADDAPVKRPLNDDSLELFSYILPKEAMWLAAPERRTLETAAWLKRGLAPDDKEQITLLESLRDQQFGAWCGKTFVEIASSLTPLQLARPAEIQPDSGESFHVTAKRVSDAIIAMLEGLEPTDDTMHMVAVAHASTIRAAIMHALGISAEHVLHIHIDPLSLTCLDYYANPKGWMVRAQNWMMLPLLG